MKTRDLSFCALFAALLALCAWISIPLGSIRFTLQTFGIFLALFTLGGKRGSIAVGIYLLLGAVGLPVFSGFQGGLAVFAGPTGGFLFGFLLTCFVYWAVLSVSPSSVPFRLMATVLGLLACYLSGFFWLKQWTDSGFFVFCLPFLLPDALKIWLAWIVARRLQKITH